MQQGCPGPTGYLSAEQLHRSDNVLTAARRVLQMPWKGRTAMIDGAAFVKESLMVCREETRSARRQRRYFALLKKPVRVQFAFDPESQKVCCLPSHFVASSSLGLRVPHFSGHSGAFIGDCHLTKALSERPGGRAESATQPLVSSKVGRANLRRLLSLIC